MMRYIFFMNCGCKICQKDLTEFVNEQAKDGSTLKEIVISLKEHGLFVTERVLSRHLSAFDLKAKTAKQAAIVEAVPVTVEILNDIDFQEYNFDSNDFDSIISYIQKINLKIYLNQAQITLKAQQDCLTQNEPVSREILQNLAVAFSLLDKATGISIKINQQEAIKVVEAMGLLNITYVHN